MPSVPSSNAVLIDAAVLVTRLASPSIQFSVRSGRRSRKDGKTPDTKSSGKPRLTYEKNMAPARTWMGKLLIA